jgi:hypothetical protein
MPRASTAHGEHGRTAGQLHPMRGRPPGERIGDADAPGRRVGVDQIGRRQGRQGRLRVQPQLGRPAGNNGGIRCAGPGHERLEQAPVECLQRVGQDGLAAVDASTGTQPSESTRQRLGGRRGSGMVAGHAMAPELASGVVVGWSWAA